MRIKAKMCQYLIIDGFYKKMYNINTMRNVPNSDDFLHPEDRRRSYELGWREGPQEEKGGSRRQEEEPRSRVTRRMIQKALPEMHDYGDRVFALYSSLHNRRTGVPDIEQPAEEAPRGEVDEIQEWVNDRLRGGDAKPTFLEGGVVATVKRLFAGKKEPQRPWVERQLQSPKGDPKLLTRKAFDDWKKLGKTASRDRCVQHATRIMEIIREDLGPAIRKGDRDAEDKHRREILQLVRDVDKHNPISPYMIELIDRVTDQVMDELPGQDGGSYDARVMRF